MIRHCLLLAIIVMVTLAVNSFAEITFESTISYHAALNPWSVIAVDLNGDGNLDLATANKGDDWDEGVDDSIAVLIGNGDGTFRESVTYPTRNKPYSIVAADLDNDGDYDLVANNYGTSNISIFKNNGDGTLEDASYLTIAGNAHPYKICTADYDGDGDSDLAVTGFCGQCVSILLNDGDGSFPSITNYILGEYTGAICTGDFNDDEYPDLAIANIVTDNISVMLGNGDGTFQDAIKYSVGKGGDNPVAVVAAYLNDDDILDLAAAKVHSDNVTVLFGNGDGTFDIKADYYAGDGPQGICAGDLDDDGNVDLIVANQPGKISILQNYGFGLFLPAIQFNAGPLPHDVCSADLDLDGDVDLAVANGSISRVLVFLNKLSSPLSANNVAAIPNSFSLSQNHPNPFNPTTTISYVLPGKSHVRLAVFNILGENVNVLVDETKAAGQYEAVWDGTDSYGQAVASGIYFYRLTAGEFSESKRMILLK